jgi:exonuclease VII large subunit
LASLAAQLLPHHNTPSSAVKAALELVEVAKHELEGVRLKGLAKSPDALAEQERDRAEYLASFTVTYTKGVKLITSQTRLDYAKKWFKEFLSVKAKEREQTPETIEARAEIWESHYRQRGFTGTEAQKLKVEFDQWRGKGRQGRVKKPASDGRFRENRQKKLQAKGKAGMAELAKPKVEWRTKHYQAAVLKGARGKKGRTYQGSADNMRDTPRGQAFDANPELQAALKEPGRT